MSYVVVAILAGLVGLTEVLSRYRDVPLVVLREWPAWTYIGTNAAAGVLALLLIDTMGWTFGEGATPDVQRGFQIAVAAFGALAVMRAAVLQIRVNDREVAVGPSLLLNALLEFTANGMARKRAGHVDEVVRKIMADVDFDRAKEPLPSYCFSLMKTPAEEQKVVSREVTSLDVATLGNRSKPLLLRIVLLELAGEEILAAAVDTLRDEIGRAG